MQENDVKINGSEILKKLIEKAKEKKTPSNQVVLSRSQVAALLAEIRKAAKAEEAKENVSELAEEKENKE